MLEESARTLEASLNEEILRHPAPRSAARLDQAEEDPDALRGDHGTTAIRVLPKGQERGLPGRSAAGGLDGSRLSPEVKRLSGLFGGETDFGQGSELLWEASRIRLTARQLQRAAASLGEEIAQSETKEVTPDHHPVTYGRTVYVGMDGTGIPMQSRETEVVGESRPMAPPRRGKRRCATSGRPTL